MVHQRSRDHEDDQQNQHHVDERRGVDVRNGDVVVAAVGQVAGREQQVRAVGAVDQSAQDLIEPLAVKLGRIAGVEAEMNVGDLGDQHGL